MEETFFYLYHCSQAPDKTLSLPVWERKWYIDRWIEQKNKENEEIKKSVNKR